MTAHPPHQALGPISSAAAGGAAARQHQQQQRDILFSASQQQFSSGLPSEAQAPSQDMALQGGPTGGAAPPLLRNAMQGPGLT